MPVLFVPWSKTWLNTAGINIIWHDIKAEKGVIKKFMLNHKSHKHGADNRLRI